MLFRWTFIFQYIIFHVFGAVTAFPHSDESNAMEVLLHKNIDKDFQGKKFKS